MKFVSWNIDSLNAALTSESNRAKMSREVLEKLKNYDIIALQETKLPVTGLSKALLDKLEEYFPGYLIGYSYSEPPARKGYSGVLTLSKIDSTFTNPKIGAPSTMDNEGRIVTLESDDFYFINVYTPNAGRDLKRLFERQEWDRVFKNYVKELDSKKPIIICGDLNVAHKEIDLNNPDGNHFTAGFTDEERKGFTELLNSGFVDTFRYIHGDVINIYSWWPQRIPASKIHNSGWRLDYFLVSNRIKDKVIKSEMIDSGDRQDHTPILLEIDL